jgi:hypothetical protein
MHCHSGHDCPPPLARASVGDFPPIKPCKWRLFADLPIANYSSASIKPA